MSESANPSQPVELDATQQEATQQEQVQLAPQPTVVVQNVTKSFMVKPDNKPWGSEAFTALHRTNLVAYEGETIGLVGHNGSGKSTLLSLIAGSEEPSTGKILVRSRPTMMGVTAALQPRLSGAKNIRIGLLAMGMDPAEVEALAPAVEEFADIGDAIYRPMMTYSAGQNARLRFAIGTCMRPEILVIDEGLATGDGAFAAVAKQRIQEIIDAAGTFFLVSHSINQVKQLCKRAVWVHEGHIIMDGPADEVTTEYQQWMTLKASDKDKAAAHAEAIAADYTAPIVRIVPGERAEAYGDSLGMFTRDNLEGSEDLEGLV